MTSYMTRLPGAPDSSEAVPGMAYFAGSGPLGKTCGDCTFKGYWHMPESNTDKPTRSYKWGGCGMYKKLTGQHGPAIDSHNCACKYFVDRRGSIHEAP